MTRNLEINSGFYDTLREVGTSQLVRCITASNPSMMTGPGTNTYLVGTTEIAVIDPGPDLSDHINAIHRAGNGHIKFILVTHTHPDHAPAAKKLASLTGARVFGFDARDGFEPDQIIGDQYILNIGNTCLRAIYTPGHASNHLCYYLEEEGILFSGDHVMDGSTVVIAPPDGDMKVYLDSLKLLRDGPLELRSIAPGHGNIITEARAKLDEYISHRYQRECAITKSLKQRKSATIADIVSDVYIDVAEYLHPIAQFSVWAHLRKLRDDGLLESDNADEVSSTWWWLV